GFALIVGFGLCELAARLVTETDIDGQAYFKGVPLRPYRFPAELTREKIRVYAERENEAYVVADPLLGWTIGTNRSSQNGLYRSNAQGIRSEPREYSLLKPAGVVRIALFGDSFTHGDEEPFRKTWGRFLEQDLAQAGIDAEVLNFGVPAYGMGQAFLRWRLEGKRYGPDIAVFGFQPENMQRAVNIFRIFYSRRTGVVFSKPRFYLGENDELELLNSPVVPPEQVADTIADLPSSPLAAYEFWYNPDNYSNSPIYTSRLLWLLHTVLGPKAPRPGSRRDYRPGRHYWDPESEPMAVAQKILEEFAREAREAGEIPIVLHIPKENDVELAEAGKELAHYRILQALEKEGVIVVDPLPAMKGKSRLYKKSHYSSKGGRIVARALADRIIRELKPERPQAPLLPAPAPGP
nr:SGNH/GDSL hydrolase family protein [bacterium]